MQARHPSQPEMAFHAAGVTLANGTTVPGDADHPWPTSVQQWFRRGYYAAVSQTDVRDASPAVQFHPNGCQFDFVWLSARTLNGAYVWCPTAYRNQERCPPETYYRSFPCAGVRRARPGRAGRARARRCGQHAGAGARRPRVAAR